MNNLKLNDKIFDTMLEVACEQLLEKKLSDWEAMNENVHVFSPDFEKQMRSLLQKNSNRVKMKKLRRTSLKIAASIILVIMAGFAATMSVSAYRHKVFNTVMEIGDKYFGFSFDEADDQVMHDTKTDDIHLPNGYSISMINTGVNESTVRIEDSDGNDIWLRIIRKEKGLNYTIDNEHVVSPYIINIHNIDITVYEREDNIYSSYFLWETSEYFYSLFGVVSTEELQTITKAIIK